ncbi:glycerophosphodiester phosphodiesterase [Kitasatospora sp. NPDC057500]|uniref:glycerophosphodiester phosphodiesterase n=1 Tax=Kitasatospora sp. NPDC057500 TaxID=3346151 RepID=UPI00369BFC06
MTKSHPSSPGPQNGRTGMLAALLALSVSTVALTAPRAVSAGPGEAVVDEGFNGPGLPTGWSAVEGDWKVEGGRLVGTSADAGRQTRIAFGRHLDDFRIEVTARFETAVDDVRWTALGLEFSRNATDAAGRDVRIAVEVHGTTARWSVDGREVVRSTRVARSADDGQALLVDGSAVSFDDVRVTALAPGAFVRQPGAPLAVFAHRGASSAAPENTLLADEVARRAGADWIENDVRPSRDGVPYVLHDDTVNRTTNGTGAVRDLTAAQLDGLDAGSWFAPTAAGARLPSLAAQLDDLRTRGGNLLLEIKGPHTRDEVARIVQEVRDHEMADRVLVQSFEADALRHTRELAPELPLALLRSSLDDDPVALSRELGLAAYHPADEALAARPEVVAALHAAGVAVNVWTVDSAARWKALDAAGVDGIITNRPAELAGWLSAHQ